MIDYLDFIEKPFVFTGDGSDLFLGTPDRLLKFINGARAVVDFKMGRIPVQPAESNLQLRSYLCMEPAPYGYKLENHPAFRPSNLIRRKMCAGSLALEAKIPPPPLDDDGGKFAEEGRLLHSHLADRAKSRDALLPEQLETVEKAEAMEAEFLEIVRAQMKPGWGYGSIIQPRIANKPFIVAYSPRDLEASMREIIALWHEAHKPDAPRRASADACTYCRATAICDEFKSWAFAIEPIAHLPAYQMTSEQLDMVLTRGSPIIKFIQDIREQAGAIKAADPDKLPGWELRDGAERRVVTDIVAAFTRLSEAISAKQFSECCQLSLGDLERIIWQSRQGTEAKLSQKAVKTLVNQILEGIVTVRRNKSSLVKVEP